MRRLMLLALALVLSVPFSAAAQVYKYKKADGTVVYTDNLAQLPPARREHYNKEREQREEKKKQLEQQIGKEELARREAEAKQKELANQQIAESERVQRMNEITAVLADIQKKRALREAGRETWRQKMIAARTKLAEKVTEFQNASEKYNTIAIQPDFARLPGQGEELTALKEKLEMLEKEIDELVLLVEETIPEQARKEGIPPGWLR